MKGAKFTIKLFNGLNKYNFEGEQWSEKITRIDGKKKQVVILRLLIPWQKRTPFSPDIKI